MFSPHSSHDEDDENASSQEDLDVNSEVENEALDLEENGGKKRPSWCLRLMCLGVKLSLVGAIILGGVILYYYSVVSGSSLEGENKWAAPAVVYGRPLELTLDQHLSYKQIKAELELLKYRRVKNPKNSGEYAESSDKRRIVVMRRPFAFADGTEALRPLLSKFSNGILTSIQSADDRQNIEYVRLEPALLDRLSANNEEDRLLISINSVPQKVIDTLIYVEDRQFYEHYGVNPWAIMRALLVNLKAGKRVQGGSTITQQLVKNYFLSREKSIDRKVRELFLSLIVDARYEKDQILEMYLNEIYLGHGSSDIYGFGLASYFYFGVPVSELNWDQAALLVGMIKGPSYYDPRRHPDRAKERRNLVLKLMQEAGKITPQEYETYAAKPLGIVNSKQNFGSIQSPAYISLLKDELERELGPNYLSLHNGLRIFTSLDPQVQLAANNSVYSVISQLSKRRKQRLQSAVVVSNWRSSEVLAVVGSSEPTFPGYNRVTKSKRQIGSLVKPAAYLTAFDNGWHLGSVVHDAPVTVKLKSGQVWTPKNFDHKFLGWMPLYKGFAGSRNIPMVRVGMNTGVENVVNTLHVLGVDEDIQPVPSILLGSVSMTPFQVNQMYATIATEGFYRPLGALRYVIAGEDRIYDRTSHLDGRQVVDPRSAYLTIIGMTKVTSIGTARSLAATYPKITLAGKTGTSNNSNDSWFSGFDNNEVVTIWIGNDDNTGTGLTGSSGALKVYHDYLKKRGAQSLEVAVPEGIKTVLFDANGYIVDRETCNITEANLVELPVRTDMIQDEQIRKCNNVFENFWNGTKDFVNDLF